jgi:hypothetical protein
VKKAGRDSPSDPNRMLSFFFDSTLPERTSRLLVFRLARFSSKSTVKTSMLDGTFKDFFSETFASFSGAPLSCGLSLGMNNCSAFQSRRVFLFFPDDFSSPLSCWLLNASQLFSPFLPSSFSLRTELKDSVWVFLLPRFSLELGQKE